MSKKTDSDLVPTYLPGSDQNGKPDSFTVRVECHKQKHLTHGGHFAKHGTIFQLDGPRRAPAPAPVSSRFGAVRDDSVSPGERIVFAYCYDNGGTDDTNSDVQKRAAEASHKRAVAIIDGVEPYRGAPAIAGWFREPHGQEATA